LESLSNVSLPAFGATTEQDYVLRAVEGEVPPASRTQPCHLRGVRSGEPVEPFLERSSAAFIFIDLDLNSYGVIYDTFKPDSMSARYKVVA
jgi:hypothetical protein